MIRTSVPRERAHTLTVLVAFLITFFVMLGMLVSVCRAKAREAALEEAALIDGASWWQIFVRVVLPKKETFDKMSTGLFYTPCSSSAYMLSSWLCGAGRYADSKAFGKDPHSSRGGS